MDYEAACRVQERVAAGRARGAIGDALLLLEHPAVITVGVSGGWEDILAPSTLLQAEGVRVLATDRGGKATYHGPGQLVAYPVFSVDRSELYHFVWRLEETVIQVLRAYDLLGERLEEHPGVWVDGKKIAAVGLAVRDDITRHGLALNVAPNMDHFRLFVPCGIANRGVTSMEQELGSVVSVSEVQESFAKYFATVFNCQIVRPSTAFLADLLADEMPPEGTAVEAQPPWLQLRVSHQAEEAAGAMASLVDDLRLHTVCQEAVCPNIAECFGRGTATFMILGDTCTRACRFCAVDHGLPQPLDGHEPERLAEAAARLTLRHIVVTSVTRDDLVDGGAGQFVAVIRAIRRRLPGAAVEVLVPDFAGSRGALQAVLDARPDVLNHNMETVPRLYGRVRPGAGYRRSLALLARCKAIAPGMVTKSGLMLGLGERTAEVLQVLRDLREVGCDLLTLGQYLQPTEEQLPVARYVPPQEFNWYREKAQLMAFRAVAAGPLVRSSYHAQALSLAMNHSALRP